MTTFYFRKHRSFHICVVESFWLHWWYNHTTTTTSDSQSWHDINHFFNRKSRISYLGSTRTTYNELLVILIDWKSSHSGCGLHHLARSLDGFRTNVHFAISSPHHADPLSACYDKERWILNLRLLSKVQGFSRYPCRCWITSQRFWNCFCRVTSFSPLLSRNRKWAQPAQYNRFVREWVKELG